MSDYFLGQIMLTGFGFAPKGFAQCNGQLLPISQNTALFSLLGTYYGGNGQSTFALPDLRGRAPVGYGSSVDPAWQPSPYAIGQSFGAETVTVGQAQMPLHTHALGAASQAGGDRNPTNSIYGTTSGDAIYGPNGSVVALAASQVQPSGGNQAHANMQPYQTINFNIALNGVYPSRS